MDESFSKGQRLRTKNDYNALRSGSARLRSGFLVFTYKENSKSKMRLGLAISRKFGNAVQRNNLKRLAREQFRRFDFKEQSLDILITVNQKAWNQRSKVKSENKAKIKADLEKGFSNLISI